MLQTITDNELIKVRTWTYGGKDNKAHFALEVINKKNFFVCVHYEMPFLVDDDEHDPLEINPNDSVIIKDQLAREWAAAFEGARYYILSDESADEAVLFRSDLEDVRNEINRILCEYNFEEKSHEEQVYNSNRITTVLEILKQIY